MPYILGFLIAVTTAIIYVTTVFKTENLSFEDNLKLVKNMSIQIEDSINKYYINHDDLSNINFEKLSNNGNLLQTNTLYDTSNNSYIIFNGSNIKWQMIQNPVDNNSYKLLIDFSNEPILFNKVGLVENFIGKTYCEKYLFGDYDLLDNTLSGNDFINNNGSNKDGKLVCIIYK